MELVFQLVSWVATFVLGVILGVLMGAFVYIWESAGSFRYVLGLSFPIALALLVSSLLGILTGLYFVAVVGVAYGLTRRFLRLRRVDPRGLT
jgi:hypothetical protein